MRVHPRERMVSRAERHLGLRDNPEHARVLQSLFLPPLSPWITDVHLMRWRTDEGTVSVRSLRAAFAQHPLCALY